MKPIKHEHAVRINRQLICGFCVCMALYFSTKHEAFFIAGFFIVVLGLMLVQQPKE